MGIWAFNLNISSHFCVHRVKFVSLRLPGDIYLGINNLEKNRIKEGNG